jgi:diacylglycerol kinase family enzyme
MNNAYDLAQNAARHGPLLVVLNAGSGRHQGSAAQDLMTEVFSQAGREFEFLQINDSAQINDIAVRAVALAKHRCGVVVAAGGDGTISAVAGAVLGSGCPFGVLPQGTFNYFGREHAIPQDTEAAARALLGASISPVQVGQVNGRVFLVNASLGLYPQLLEDRETWKKTLWRGRFVAFIAGIATLLKWRKQLNLSIELAGQTADLRTSTLFVGNNQLQLAQVGIDDKEVQAVQTGELAGIVVRPIGTLAMLGLLLRGMGGRLGDADHITSFSFQTMTVTPRSRKTHKNPQSQKRIKVATDGETVWMVPPLVFRVAPEPLLLLVPAPADRVEVA